MMKILCISLLLTTAFVSVCLSASLVDDQLAQILGEKLQSDSMTDPREYASIEDINEFERRLAALEKLGEVTDQLFPDNTPEEYVGGPNKSKKKDKNDREKDNSLGDIGDTGYDCLKNSATTEDLTECYNVYYLKHSQKDAVKEKRNPFCGRYSCGGKKRNYPDDKTGIDNVCTKSPKTLEDIVHCIKIRTWHRNSNNVIDKLKKKRNPFCGRYKCHRKRSVNYDVQGTGGSANTGSMSDRGKSKSRNVGKVPQNEEDAFDRSIGKTIPFCGRYSCGNKGKFKKRFCNRFGCRSSFRKAREVAKLLLGPDKISQDTTRHFNKPFIRNALERKEDRTLSTSLRQKSDKHTTLGDNETTNRVKFRDIMRKNTLNMCGITVDDCLIKKVLKKKKKGQNKGR